MASKQKYCRFKKMGIKYIDYKDPEFLMRFLNEQGKLLPRRITGNSLKFQRNLKLRLILHRHQVSSVQNPSMRMVRYL